ncbi:hypothetical protein VTK26DRAFT_8909 [Humicola hyalothermophila]
MHLPSSLLFLAALPAALAGKGCKPPKPSKGLHALAKEAGLLYFGAATDSPGQREREGYEHVYPQYDQIMWESGEFGATTPTNGQKWLFVEPERGVWNYTEGEIVTSKAKEHGMYLRCHALVWHSQLAPWVEEGDWTPDELRKIIVDHIEQVAGHWKGQCYAWDVVNEAFEEDGSFRESIFYRVLGEEYIKLAFKTAARVDPHAKLYLNDYNFEWPHAKTEAAKRLVRTLQDEGIRIDGVGLQAHLIAEDHPTIDQHIDAIRGFADLGVEVAITELDVRLTTPSNETNLAMQRESYTNVVGACVQVPGCIGITIWDFYDPFSWVPYTFPGEGEALLWFEDFSKHPAYYGVVEALTNKTSGPGNGNGKGKGKGKGNGPRANLWRA